MIKTNKNDSDHHIDSKRLLVLLISEFQNKKSTEQHSPFDCNTYPTKQTKKNKAQKRE